MQSPALPLLREFKSSVGTHLARKLLPHAELKQAWCFYKSPLQKGQKEKSLDEL